MRKEERRKIEKRRGSICDEGIRNNSVWRHNLSIVEKDNKFMERGKHKKERSNKE